jgi:DNA replication protein DnaC
MLTIETLKKRLTKINSPDWLHVAVDVNNANQIYIVGNGGMGTTISASIENYLPEIKEWVVSMISLRELIKDEKKSLLLDRNILVHYLSLSLVHEEEL